MAQALSTVAAQDVDLFRVLVESVREYAIFMLAPDGTVASWNAGAERIKGYAAAEIIGRHFSVFYPAEDVRDGKPARVLEAAERKGSTEEEGWRVRKDGTRFWASAVITALRDAQGRLTGFGKVTRDMTERRRGDQARAHLVMAHEAVRARDDFLAIASHELRTPLTGLRLLAQSILRGAQVGRALSEGQLDRLRSVDRYVSRLERLVKELLDVTTLAAGQLSLARSRFDLAELVRELGVQWSAEAARHGATLVCQASDPIPGEWDRDRVRDALAAVLGNAVKYGGAAPIELHAWAEGGRAVVEVVDQGPGIAPEDQARVFERFERAVPAAHYGGFGIGLWAARQIVSAHGGDIEIRSAPGQGSRFTIRLPLPPPAGDALA